MNKTFNSAFDDSNFKLRVGRVFGADNFLVDISSGGYTRSMAIAPSDAPALALAILEAANHDMGSEVSFAVEYLERYTEAVAEKEAEAKEQAKLEAEALELFNTFWRSDGEGPSSIENWRVPNEEREDWLAVARTARELNKEDGQ